MHNMSSNVKVKKLSNKLELNGNLLNSISITKYI